jgi:hypothetical protein
VSKAQLDILAIGALLGLVVIFFSPLIFFGQTILSSDVLYQYYPWKFGTSITPQRPMMYEPIRTIYVFFIYLIDSPKNRTVPLWNPYILCGTPFYHMSATLDPLNAVVLIFTPTTAYDAIVWSQFFLAGLFMYFYMRAINTNRFGSLVAAIAYAFNGYHMVFLKYKTFVGSTMWIPLILLFLERAIQRKSLLHAVIAGIALALQSFSGNVQITLYTTVVIILYSGFRAVVKYRDDEDKKQLIRTASVPLTAIIVGLGLAAIQLVPLYELGRLSARLPRYKGRNYLPVHFLHHLVIPPDIDNFGKITQQARAYMGSVPILLAVIAGIFRKGKETKLFSCLAVGIILMLLSMGTPLYTWIANLFPALDKMYHLRTLILYELSVSVLAGFGGDFLTRKSYNPTKIAAVLKTFVAGMILAYIGIVLGYLTFHLRWGQGYIPEKYLDNPLALELFDILRPGLYVPFLTAIIFIVGLTLYLKSKVSDRLFMIVTIVLTTLTLFHFGFQFSTFANRELTYPKTEAIEFLQANAGLYRVHSIDPAFPPNTLMAYAIQDIDGFESLYIGRYNEYVSAIEDTDKVSLESPFSDHVEVSRYKSKMLDMLGIKYVVVPPSVKISDDQFQLVFDREVRIYENKDVLPRVFIVPEAKVAQGTKQVFVELKDVSFDPRRTVILESQVTARSTNVRSSWESSANVMSYTPNRVLIDANLSDGGFLVLSDTHYPGWQVYVDGEERRILRANYIMRAVYLDQGQHSVEFVYNPVSFKIGLSFSLLILMGVISYVTMFLVNRFRLRDFKICP